MNWVEGVTLFVLVIFLQIRPTTWVDVVCLLIAVLPISLRIWVTRKE